MIGEASIRQILQEFNGFGDRNKQDTYLCGLINPQPVARKRKRIGSEKDRHASFKYKVSKNCVIHIDLYKPVVNFTLEYVWCMSIKQTISYFFIT